MRPLTAHECRVNAADCRRHAEDHKEAAERFNPAHLTPEALLEPVPNVGIPAIVFWRRQMYAAQHWQATADAWEGCAAEASA